MKNLVATIQPQAINKNFSSLEELYGLYSRPAFGLAVRVLNDSVIAEEAVQEVFLRYWQQPGLYTTRSGPFINWLLREVHCNCLDRLKSSLDVPQRSRFSPGPKAPGATLKKDEPASAQETGRLNTLQEQARQTVAGLSPEHRNLLEMAFFKGLTHQEIARTTGKPVQIVRQTLTRSLIQLKEELAR